MKILYAVIVTYNPDSRQLNQTIRSLADQVEGILLVNNSSEYYSFPDLDNVRNIVLSYNHGIAYAQNRGIELALELGADYILLSDQDTVYPAGYIESFAPFVQKQMADAYCPVFYDNVKNVHSPVMIGKFRFVPSVDEPTFVQHAIASGLMIDVRCLGDVGFMDESLFIDYVDFEFCWRLTYKGYKILTVPSIIINHQLGDGSRKFLHKQITVRPDIRYFYILRNGFYLTFYCKYLSFVERMSLLRRTMSFSCGVFLLRPSCKSVRLILSAFYDGVTKRLGKKES